MKVYSGQFVHEAESKLAVYISARMVSFRSYIKIHVSDRILIIYQENIKTHVPICNFFGKIAVK